MIKNRRPALAEIVVAPVSLDAIVSPAEIERQHPKVLKLGERPAPAVSAMGLIGPSDEMIDRYNGELEKFYRGYASHYAKVRQVADLKRRYVKLAFRLKNIGRASATHIQATVRLPEGMRTLEESPS